MERDIGMNPLADAIVEPLKNRNDAVLIDADGGALSGVELHQLSGQIYLNGLTF